MQTHTKENITVYAPETEAFNHYLVSKDSNNVSLRKNVALPRKHHRRFCTFTKNKTHCSLHGIDTSMSCNKESQISSEHSRANTRPSHHQGEVHTSRNVQELRKWILKAQCPSVNKGHQPKHKFRRNRIPMNFLASCSWDSIQFENSCMTVDGTVKGAVWSIF